jgi:Zn-dependent protease
MNKTRHSVPLGSLFGIPIDLDFSWFLIFGLLTWMLAVGYFPQKFKGGSLAEYWILGAVSAVMLFVCVLLHELGHSLVAQRYNVSVGRITMFIFGGVSQITAEPPSASAEFWISIAGPAVSFALALFFSVAKQFVVGYMPLLAMVTYLALLNLILGMFNLLPGFPLDGGRVLRAAVWGATRDFRRATLVAANTGRFFGYFMIFSGLFLLLHGDVFDGIWIAFIGWFLESAASSQVQQTMVRGLLVGHKVGEVMKREFEPLPGDLTLEELVEKHVLVGGQRAFIISRSGRPVGLLTLSTVREVPRSKWATTTAGEAMVPMERLISIPASAELWTALEKMGRDGVNQLPVVDDGTIIGLLARDDVVDYLRVLQQLSR